MMYTKEQAVKIVYAIAAEIHHRNGIPYSITCEEIEYGDLYMTVGDYGQIAICVTNDSLTIDEIEFSLKTGKLSQEYRRCYTPNCEKTWCPCSFLKMVYDDYFKRQKRI